MTDIFEQLKAEFPRNAISWRAQSLNKEGTAAMALAYIDARDVMNRLDDVLGPDGWQCRYPHANGKTVCEIGIRVGDEWIWKADGAGDSDIEAEKGALSDAFKRAAVRWGIGRYLYDLESPWVDCEHYTNHQGKKVWKRWTQDPWSKVKNSSSAPSGRNATPAVPRTSSGSVAPLSQLGETYRSVMLLAKTKDDLGAWMNDKAEELKEKLGEAEASTIRQLAAARYRELPEARQEAAE